MRLGIVGLGKMGAGMRKRLRAAGHQAIGYDQNPELSDFTSLHELLLNLDSPRTVWVMVPAGHITTDTITHLSHRLERGDLVIDGGNTRYTQDQQHADLLAAKGVNFLDVGVSGGVWGPENGYGLMVGGATEHVQHLMPIFDALRPEGPREEGFVHAGPTGAGHFAKMIHNGTEYGLMQAYAEGYELLEASELITDVSAVLKAWQRGTVVRSWLLNLLVGALDNDPELSELKGVVNDSGEGRWTVEEAVSQAIPAPVITAALFARFSSRQPDSPAMRAIAALRQQFGGHAVQAASTDSDH